tara:strand:+ start:1113 stop:1586 length:474 start_codon:yes stop_codon:yes gene_type:complete
MPGSVSQLLAKVSNDNFKQKILGLFITNYLELLDLFKELSYTIDIVTLININHLLKKTNPKVMPHVWKARFGSPFHQQIHSRNLEYFIENDCSDTIINSIEFTNINIKETCIQLIEHYRNAIRDGFNDEVKNNVLNKIKDKAIIVTNLANKYIEIDK